MRPILLAASLLVLPQVAWGQVSWDSGRTLSPPEFGMVPRQGFPEVDRRPPPQDTWTGHAPRAAWGRQDPYWSGRMPRPRPAPAETPPQVMRNMPTPNQSGPTRISPPRMENHR